MSEVEYEDIGDFDTDDDDKHSCDEEPTTSDEEFIADSAEESYSDEDIEEDSDEEMYRAFKRYKRAKDNEEYIAWKAVNSA